MRKLASIIFVIGLLMSSAACNDRQKESAKADYYDTKESVDRDGHKAKKENA